MIPCTNWIQLPMRSCLAGPVKVERVRMQICAELERVNLSHLVHLLLSDSKILVFAIVVRADFKYVPDVTRGW